MPADPADRPAAHHPAALLPPFDGEGRLTCVVETVRGSRVKYRYDEHTGTFTVAHVLALGLAFPCEFAFVPGTRADDGDPLDALVLFDDATFAGCVLPCHPLGVLRAEQRDERDDATAATRNDRIVAVAEHSHLYRRLRALDDVPADLVRELEHFLVAYDAARGIRFTVLGRDGPDDARRLVRERARGRS